HVHIEHWITLKPSQGTWSQTAPLPIERVGWTSPICASTVNCSAEAKPLVLQNASAAGLPQPASKSWHQERRRPLYIGFSKLLVAFAASGASACREATAVAGGLGDAAAAGVVAAVSSFVGAVSGSASASAGSSTGSGSATTWSEAPRGDDALK